MKLDLPLSENWELLNDLVEQKLSIQGPLQARVYKDLSSAILEIAQGTAQFFSHKKSLGFIKGQTPAFDFLLPHFYKEAFQIKHTSYTHVGDVKDWVESLNKDTSFVLFAEDHPVTGEKYIFCDELDRLLNEKRIYSIRISHARFAKEDLEVRPYSVRICSWAVDLAIVVCGERFRSPSMVVHRQNWDQDAVASQIQRIQSEHVSQPQKIKDFENKLTVKSAGIQAWFQPTQERIWDRAVLNFTGVNAEALAQLLFKKLGLEAPQAWQMIETTNMCRWGVTRMYQNWWEPLPKDDILRGLLIFDAKILDAKDFADLVLSSYEEIQQLQTW